MNKLFKIILTSNLVWVLFISCNLNKREVLKASLTDVGTCCSGSLILYSNNSFKISYSVFEDDFGSTCKGDYRIDGGHLDLESDELSKIGDGSIIDEVGDLFNNQYRFDQERLIPLSGGNELEIYYFDTSFFRIPCGIVQKEIGLADAIFSFNLCDSLLALDTINMDNMEFDPLSHIDNCKIIFNMPEGCEIIEAERQVYVYPTIWSSPADELLQYIQLDDLVYIAKRKLIIQKPNTLIYPKIELTKNILKQFQNITKDKLRFSLDNILLNSNDSYNNENIKDKEKRIWMGYIDKYTEGDFYYQTNDIFDVNYSEFILKVKFNFNGKVVTKLISGKAYYGN
jgi:hypothetical protein